MISAVQDISLRFSLVPSVRVQLGYLAWRCSGSEEQGISYGLLIVWIGRSALDPDISTFEKFMLQMGAICFTRSIT